MVASILAFFKALAEILGLTKYFYNEVKDTPIEKEQKIDEAIAEEKTQAQSQGRPKWD